MVESQATTSSQVTEAPQVESPTKQYLYPYWSNKETRHLIVTIKHTNGVENLASIMDPDNTNPDMKAIFEQYTEEDIDRNTEEGLRRRNDNIKKRAERRQSQAAREIQEILFNAKLQAFEIDAIKHSKDIELKKLIRKSKNVMEVQAYATILLMKELNNGGKESTN